MGIQVEPFIVGIFLWFFFSLNKMILLLQLKNKFVCNCNVYKTQEETKQMNTIQSDILLKEPEKDGEMDD